MTTPRDRLIVALDFPDRQSAVTMATRLEGVVRWVKVGLELYVSEGPAVVSSITSRGFDVFLDLKFHDIPNTVEGACRRAAATGAGLINVHAGGGEAMMEAAARGAQAGAWAAGKPAPKVLAVTVLTSLTGQELPGYYAASPVAERVLLLARAARNAGLDGVVASPQEIEPLRAALGPEFIILTPGIRFAGGEAGDQKRIATPGAAVRRGADFIVMGRPVTQASDPRGEAERAIREMAE